MTRHGETVLDIRDLTISYGSASPVVRGIDLTVRGGEIVGLIGESGSGKSSIAMSCLGLLGHTAKVSATRLEVCGQEVTGLSKRGFATIRGTRVAMVFQDAMGALDPTMKVGDQVAEVVRRHRGVGRVEASRLAVELLDRVGIPEAGQRARQYPHAFSGGLRQRAAIAIALAGDPDLLFADEPTTALDVTVQAGILDLFRSIRDEFGVGIVLISHDIGVIAQTADRVAVMLDGRIVEQGTAHQVLTSPASDYTSRLLDAAPTLHGATSDRQPGGRVLLSATSVTKTYRVGGQSFQALRGIDVDVHEGEVLGIVGESGSGKSTLAKLFVRLEQPTSGTLRYDGDDLSRLSGSGDRAFRRRVQMVFQHPSGSLDPRMRVRSSVREPLDADGALAGPSPVQRVLAALEEVGLSATQADRLPHELSGGQKQRVGIARSIVGSAEFIVLDEPTSALDVSVQAQVLDLLSQLRAQHGLTLVLISHNLAVVREMSDRVAVMRSGEIVEIGTATQIFTDPQHEYTRQLLAAVPSPVPAEVVR